MANLALFHHKVWYCVLQPHAQPDELQHTASYSYWLPMAIQYKSIMLPKIPIIESIISHLDVPPIIKAAPERELCLTSSLVTQGFWIEQSIVLFIMV